MYATIIPNFAHTHSKMVAKVNPTYKIGCMTPITKLIVQSIIMVPKLSGKITIHLLFIYDS